MDTSISTTTFVTGNLRIPANDIKPEDWLKIIGSAVQLAKPYIKHFPDYRVVGEVINGDCGRRRTKKTDSAIVSLDTDLKLTTRFQWVNDLDSKWRNRDTRYVTRSLMLSQEGRWFDWKAGYNVTKEFANFREDTTILTATSSEFRWLSDDDFLAILTEDGGRGLLYLNILANLTSHVLDKRRKQLGELEVLHQSLRDMESRIER